MKKITCKNCNESWYINNQDINKQKNCPFCSSNIKKRETIVTIDTLEKALYVVIQKFGEDILFNSSKMHGYLMDLAPSLKKEIKIYSKSINTEQVNLIKDALNQPENEARHTLERLRFFLVEEEGLSEQWATMIIECLFNLHKYCNEGYSYTLNIIVEEVDLNTNKRTVEQTNKSTTTKSQTIQKTDEAHKLSNQTKSNTSNNNASKGKNDQSQASKGRYYLKYAIMLYNQKSYRAQNAFLEALNHGENEACVYLGKIEKERSNYKKAIEWFLKAANFGIGEGAFCAAEMYYEEYRSNNTQLARLFVAQKYYQMAVNLGYNEASEKLNNVYQIIQKNVVSKF